MDPLRLFARSAGRPRFFWEQPAHRQAIAGIGSAVTISIDDGNRYEQTKEAWRNILVESVVDAPDGVVAVGPILVGGYSFDASSKESEVWSGFPSGKFFLPRLSLSRTPVGSWLTYNLFADHARIGIDSHASPLITSALEDARSTDPAGPVVTNRLLTEEPRREVWMDQVASAVKQILDGRAEKVVLARRADLEFDISSDPGSTLAALARDYPLATVFAFGEGEKCFLGASPERLVNKSGDRIAVACLAGSVERASDELEDHMRVAQLMASAKDRSEHEIVLRAIRQSLQPITQRLVTSESPEIVSLRNVHHLCTPITATMTAGLDIIDAVAALHPTPAVGGFPREAAMTIIRETETFDRGWYAGPIGWMNRKGDGEFSVAIRSALIDGPRTSLFAGCGIVSHSDPAMEWQESEVKLRAMMSGLGLS